MFWSFRQPLKFTQNWSLLTGQLNSYVLGRERPVGDSGLLQDNIPAVSRQVQFDQPTISVDAHFGDHRASDTIAVSDLPDTYALKSQIRTKWKSNISSHYISFMSQGQLCTFLVVPVSIGLSLREIKVCKSIDEVQSTWGNAFRTIKINLYNGGILWLIRWQ